MVLYLARHYFINSIAFLLLLLVIPVLVGESWESMIHRSIFWGSFFGLIYTNYSFSKMKLWPLYDNLRISKYWVLSGLFLTIQLFNLFLGALL